MAQVTRINFLGYNLNMDNLFQKIRFWDFHSYLFLHNAIVGRPWLNALYLFFAKYGIVLILLSFVYLILKRRAIAFVCGFISLFIAVLISVFISVFWQRPRPYISHSDTVMTPILNGLYVDSISFPSAHTFFAFTVATAVFLYGHRRLGFFLYLLAILVAIGRIGAGLHYPSDTIFGAIIGIFSGYVGYKIVERSQVKWEQ